MICAASCGSSTPCGHLWCCWGLCISGLLRKYRDWAEKAAKNRFVQALVFVPLFLLTTSILGLPLDAYQQSISRQYGLRVQGWGSWFGDVLKGKGISLVVGTLLLWLMVFIHPKEPAALVVLFLADPVADRDLLHLHRADCD